MMWGRFSETQRNALTDRGVENTKNGTFWTVM